MAVSAPAASAHSGCHTRACVERVAAKQCSQQRPLPCIRRAALRWRVSFPMLLRKARCESGSRSFPNGNPYAINGSPLNRAPVRTSRSTGLMQFMPGTWQTTPYRHRSIWRAKWNALAAGWMHHVHRGSEWSCR